MDHEQVQLAIIVVVQKSCTGAPSAVSHTGPLRHIGEGPITVVVIQNVAKVGCYVQILIAVIVVIAGCYPSAVASPNDSRFRRHVCEGAIPVVSV